MKPAMMRFPVVVSLLFLCVSLLAKEPPSRPQILGIARVQIFVSDVPAARAFYSKVLNPAQQCNSCDEVPGGGLAVNAVQGIVLSPVPSPAPTNLIEEITFATDDLAKLRKYLAFYKIAMSKPEKPKDAYLTLVDPEGHRIAFVERSAGFAKLVSPSAIQLIHSGFVVRDRAAEDHFYRDILGLRPYWHGGMKDNQDDWVALQVPDGTDWVEYMLNISPNADHHTLGVMNHIALGVADIHATETLLIANGWKPGETPKMGRDGKWQLNLYDPDDARVEFMEFKPAQEPCCSPFTGPHPGPSR